MDDLLLGVQRGDEHYDLDDDIAEQYLALRTGKELRVRQWQMLAELCRRRLPKADLRDVVHCLRVCEALDLALVDPDVVQRLQKRARTIVSEAHLLDMRVQLRAWQQRKQGARTTAPRFSLHGPKRASKEA